MGEGSRRGGDDLKERVGVLGVVVVLSCAGVHLFKVASKNGRFLLLGDDVNLDTVEKGEAEGLEPVAWCVPWASLDRLKTVDRLVVVGQVTRAAVGCDDIASVLPSGSLGVSLDVIAGIGDLSSIGINLSASLVATVVVLDSLVAFWLWWRWWTPQQKGTLEGIVPFKLPIVVDNLTVKVWDNKDDGQKTHANGNTQNDTKVWTRTPFLDIWKSAGSSLPDDKHGERSCGQGDVKWNCYQGSASLVH